MTRLAQEGAFVVVGGPDGAGKTTLADALLAAWPGEARYFHFLPDLRRGLRDRPALGAAPLPKRSKQASVPVGILRLVRSLVRAWLGYLVRIRPARRRGALVVGDRWLYGYVTQPAAVGFAGPAQLARLALRLAPRPDLLLLLDAPTHVIRSRKQELTVADIERERPLWRSLDPKAARVLDARGAPGDLAAEVLAMLTFRQRTGRLVQYPPWSGQVLIPARPWAAALGGTTLYAPGRTRTMIAHRLARGVVRVGAAPLLRSGDPLDGLPASTWVQLMDALSGDGIPTGTVAVYRREAGRRDGLSLLVLGDGEPVAFVKVGAPDSIDREAMALHLVEKGRPTLFRHPEVMAHGTVDSSAYLATTVVLDGFHRPARRPPLAEILAEIRRVLEPLPRSDDVPEHWVPIHGDFTPWNLRRTRRGLSLFDWEHAGWGPEEADEVLFVESAIYLGQRMRRRAWSLEAAEFWLRADVPEDSVRLVLERYVRRRRRSRHDPGAD